MGSLKLVETAINFFVDHTYEKNIRFELSNKIETIS